MASARQSRGQSLTRQLWASHLIVIAITLVALVGAMILLGGAWMVRQGFVIREPALDAEAVSIAYGNLIRRGVPEPLMSEVLAETASGGIRMGAGPLETERGPRFMGPPALRRDLQSIDYVVIVGPGGRVLASSDGARFPPDSAFPPQGVAGWNDAVARALAGDRDPTRLSSQVPNGLALGAFPISAESGGRPIAAVAIAKQPPPHDAPSLLARGVAIFGIGTILVLTGSSVFALTFSGLAAYKLSRRLGRRLERVSQAADAMAQGDLSQRVPLDDADEIGRLAERFNLMAERLQESMTALETEKGKVEESLRTRRELIANVSHELRTPLALMRSHVESLAMAENGIDGTRANRQQYLEVIEREVDHLSALIDDLFALSTADAGVLSLKLEAVNLGAVAAEVADAIAPIARQERRVTLLNDVGADLPAVQADRQRLTQVLANLLRNALRYTPEGGLISISAAPVDGQVEVSVADTGLGIPPDQLPHVFERFYRGDAARDRASGGAGLGLAIVRELVEAMGGRVAVESVVGEGSRFSFTLQAADGLTPEAPRPYTRTRVRGAA
jgi:signal transduction histidine kinase